MKFLWPLIVLAVIVGVCVHITGAKNCHDQGGTYLRDWTGWPICVQVEKVIR